MIDNRLGLRPCSHCVLRPPPVRRQCPRLPGGDGPAAPFRGQV